MSGVIPLFPLHVVMVIRWGNKQTVYWSRMDKRLFFVTFLVFGNLEYEPQITFAQNYWVSAPPPPRRTHVLLLAPIFYKQGDTLYSVTCFGSEQKMPLPQPTYGISLPSALFVPTEEIHRKWQLEILERIFHLGHLRVYQKGGYVSVLAKCGSGQGLVTGSYEPSCSLQDTFFLQSSCVLWSTIRNTNHASNNALNKIILSHAICCPFSCWAC